MIKVYIGWPGTGKTQAMIDHIAANASKHRFFVVDRAAEWDASSPRWRGKTIPIMEIMHGKELPDMQPDGVYLFRPPWTSDDVATLVVEQGDAIYVDDELDIGATIAGWQSNPLREIVHRGRHIVSQSGEVTQAHIMGAARRPQSMHPDITAIADEAHIFRVGGALTLRRMRDDAWIEDYEWEKIRNLPNLMYRHFPSGNYYRIKDAFRVP